MHTKKVYIIYRFASHVELKKNTLPQYNGAEN